MLWMSGASLRWLTILAVGVVAMIPIAWTYLLRDYQKARLEAFLNADAGHPGCRFPAPPGADRRRVGWADRQGPHERDPDAGRTSCPSRRRTSCSRPWPRSSGFIGGVVLFVLFVLLLWRVLVAGWRSRDAFGTLFAAGVASMILFQLVVNVGMVLGVMPITGIPLPFVTHGGASLVSMAAGLGILQSINIRQTRAAW